MPPDQDPAPREQRLVFGEDPELYDKARAGYPADLVSEVMSFGSLVRGDRAVEVGAGTGKATVAFARAGLQITAIEPSPEMAAVSSRNCAAFPEVSVVVSAFEDWDGGGELRDLVFAAQSWHWIDPSVRYAKAATLLRDGGTLALMWHRTDWAGEELHDELDELYRRVDPELRERNPGFPGLDWAAQDDLLIAEIEASGFFEGAEDRTFHRVDTFGADGFVNLLATQSDHRLLPDERRIALFSELRGLIERHGGTVEVPHATWLIMVRRSSTTRSRHPSPTPGAGGRT